MLDVTVWRQADSMTVHLVNMTNPMMMRGPFRELIPAGPFQVCVRLPEAQAAQAVGLLHSKQSPPYELSEGRLTLTVDSILDHEIVAVDLAALQG